MSDMLKIELTQVQREYLEFCVNRRLNDVIRECLNNRDHIARPSECRKCGEEVRALTVITKRLIEATV